MGARVLRREVGGGGRLRTKYAVKEEERAAVDCSGHADLVVTQVCKSRPSCFHSLNSNSICQRTRASTSTSWGDSWASGTLVIRRVQSAHCNRAWLTIWPRRRAVACNRRCQEDGGLHLQATVPAAMTTVVLADRGRYAHWLFQAIAHAWAGIPSYGSTLADYFVSVAGRAGTGCPPFAPQPGTVHGVQDPAAGLLGAGAGGTVPLGDRPAARGQHGGHGAGAPPAPSERVSAGLDHHSGGAASAGAAPHGPVDARTVVSPTGPGGHGRTPCALKTPTLPYPGAEHPLSHDRTFCHLL